MINKSISASGAKNNFGSLLEEVYVKGKSVTITKNDKPIAKVVLFILLPELIRHHNFP